MKNPPKAEYILIIRGQHYYNADYKEPSSFKGAKTFDTVKEVEEYIKENGLSLYEYQF